MLSGNLEASEAKERVATVLVLGASLEDKEAPQQRRDASKNSDRLIVLILSHWNAIEPRSMGTTVRAHCVWHLPSLEPQKDGIERNVESQYPNNSFCKTLG